jgi:drug/metabolite transporter (DMT)-like permease
MKANPYLQVLLAILIMGSSGAFIKFLNLPPTTLSFFRMAVPAGLLYLYFSVRKVNLFRYHSGWMLFGSMLNAIRIFLFVFGFTYTSISNAVLILNSWPVFANLFSMLFLGEKVPRRNLLLLLLPLSGIMLLFINQPLSVENEDFLGMSAMLFSAMIYASTIIIFKRESPKYSGYETTFFQNLAGAIIFLPFLWYHDFDFSVRQISLGIVYAFLVGIVAFGLYFSALRQIKASTISFLSYLEVVVATSFGILLFDEALSWNIIAGGSLIIVSTLLLKKQ